MNQNLSKRELVEEILDEFGFVLKERKKPSAKEVVDEVVDEDIVDSPDQLKPRGPHCDFYGPCGSWENISIRCD